MANHTKCAAATLHVTVMFVRRIIVGINPTGASLNWIGRDWRRILQQPTGTKCALYATLSILAVQTIKEFGAVALASDRTVNELCCNFTSDEYINAP